MAEALRPLTEAQKKEVNRFISAEDSKKDVFMTNKKERIQANGTKVRETFALDREDHRFVLDLIHELYGRGGQGGGGNNPRIQQKLTEAFGRDLFQKGPSQQFSLLRMDGNNVRIFSLRNKHLVIDTGVQSSFGEECKSVIGPFSVIDPGSRSLSGQVNLLGTAMTYDYTQGACGTLDMQGYVRSIQYQNVGGEEPYQFTVQFTGGEQTTFKYSKTRVSNSPSVNSSKNYKRNELVKDMVERYPALNGKTLAQVQEYSRSVGGDVQRTIDTFIHDLRFQLWWKEMGDTSFPVWIQSYMGTYGIKPETTVVCSIDWGVIYRSLVNGMACALQLETQTTYYPIVDGVFRQHMVEDAALGKRGRGEQTVQALKKSLLSSLLTQNQHVLDLLRKCRGIVDRNPMCFLASITEPTWYTYAGEYKEFRIEILQSFMRILCNTMIRYVKPLMKAIEAELRPEATTSDGLVEFRIKVGNYRLRTPFVTFGGDQCTIPKHSFQFLPVKVGGSGDHVFGLGSILRLYSDVYKRAALQEPTVEQVVACMKDLYGTTVDPAPADWAEEEDSAIEVEDSAEEAEERPGKRARTQGGGGLSEEDKGLYAELLQHNSHLPNFLLYFVNRYVPEFFPMALAYELALERRDARVLRDAYTPVLTYAILEKALAPFGRTVDGRLEYTKPPLRRSRSGSVLAESARVNRTPLIHHACSILRGARSEKNILFSLCTDRAPELLWFIEAVGGPTAPFPQEEAVAVHVRALGYYQQFYDEDVRLCILNRRQAQTPLDGIEMATKAVEVKGTPGRALSEDLRERFSQPFQQIYERHRAAAVKKGPTAKARGFFQSTSALQKLFKTSKKRTAERRRAFLTRRRSASANKP